MNEKIKTKIPITNEIFQLIRNMLLSENSNIQMKDILEVKRFFDVLDFDRYVANIEGIKASDFLSLLEKIIEVSLRHNSTQKKLIIQELLNESKDKDKFEVIYTHKEEISNDDLIYLKEFMSSHVSAAYIFHTSDQMKDFITDLQAGNYDSIHEFVDKFRDLTSTNYQVLHELKTKTTEEKLDTDFNLDSLTNLAVETVKEVSTPGYYLNTGLMNLDNAMGGGLKRGALTLFGAVTAGFKSGMMLNLMCSIKIFSKNIETFDKTKKPCLIMLSMENTQSETFKRMTAYANNMGTVDIKTKDPKELAEKTIEALTPVNTSSPDTNIKLLYRPSNSIDINDIYSIISDAETEGYEVVALFVDYLSTMNSRRFQAKDMQSKTLALEDNARELYNLAINKKIAVVSGFQLNRQAYQEHGASGKNTLAFVGGSLGLATHADYIFNITKAHVKDPKDPDSNIHYIRFEEAKQRSTNGSANGYFYEVFSRNNTFRLLHSKYYKNEDGSSINFTAFDEYVKKQLEETKLKNLSNNSLMNPFQNSFQKKQEDKTANIQKNYQINSQSF